MSYQKIQGVKILPKGSKNRFVSQNWGVSEAFGGWIFNASCSIGFSDKPTEISMKIVLESNSDLGTLIPKVFDIDQEDLKCSAGTGGSGNESLFDIDFNGVKFEDFILFSYDIDIQPQQKTLSVTFRDYSLILDKIYVGLIKRQGSEFIKLANASGIIPMVCPDCSFASFTGEGNMIRDIDYGSYVGINGKTYDNFVGAPLTNVMDAWNYLYQRNALSPNFDLNGGYVILGSEEMYSEVCATIPEVKYSFKQLIESLSIRGLNFLGDFSGAFLTGGLYTQNYIGTLREVMNNWCSDFGMQFYTSGKSFIGLDLKKEIDISSILEVADPKSYLGKSFDGGQNGIALGNYKESYSLENTYRQSVITADVRPREIKSESREVKNFVHFQPLHPLDFYSPDWTTQQVLAAQNRGTNVFRPLLAVQFANNFNPSRWFLETKRLSTFTNRLFRDIDVCIALTKYDKELRDIYCLDRAINSSDVDFYANFSALGFFPKKKIENKVSKEAILRKFRKTDSQNISLDPDFYEIYIGYYSQSLRDEVISYESNWAGSMYKYGVLNIGTTNEAPYIIRDRNDLLQPNAGLFGDKGESLLRITNSFTPGAAVYPIYQNAPYYELMPYKVIGFDPNSYSGISTQNIGFDSNNYYIASLTNEWGTLPEEYKRNLYEPLSPICEQMFAGSQSLQEAQSDLYQKAQQFNIKDFSPTFHSEISEIYSDLKTELDNLSDLATDELGIFAVGTDSKIHQECAKLHVVIVPNIRSHPNVRISFQPQNYNSEYNTIMAKNLKMQFEENRISLLKEKPKNACDYSALTVMCNSGIHQRSISDPGDIKYSCANVDDPNVILYAGWPSGYAYSNNARSLLIKIERNPVTEMDARGSDGEYYYMDLANQDVRTLMHRASYAKIVYPICNDPTFFDGEYIGILNTNINRDIRTPPFLEIYGSPVNVTENNTISVKTINNTIDPDVQPILDPNTRKFIKYATVYSGQGGSNVLHSIQDYHNFVAGLNSYQSSYPMKSASFSVIGSPNLFGDFIGVVNPKSGLNNFNITISDNGIETNLSFANRPPVLAKQEAILNKIGPRLKPK